MIAGELDADEGTVTLKKGATLGYYRQGHEVRAEGSVMDNLLAGFGDLLKLRQELSRAQEEAASGDAAALDRLSTAMDRYQHAGADQLERRVEMIAMRLGFAPRDLERDVRTLSGGERGRLSLGVVLANEPEVLFLDEPTNHLDHETIEWLATYLNGWQGAVLVVFPDRAPFWTRSARRQWGSAEPRSAAIPCPTRSTMKSARRIWSASAGCRRTSELHRQDGRLHPQEHCRPEDQTSAIAKAHARQARSRRPPRGRVGARRARAFPFCRDSTPAATSCSTPRANRRAR